MGAGALTNQVLADAGFKRKKEMQKNTKKERFQNILLHKHNKMIQSAGFASVNIDRKHSFMCATEMRLNSRAR